MSYIVKFLKALPLIALSLIVSCETETREPFEYVAGKNTGRGMTTEMSAPADAEPAMGSPVEDAAEVMSAETTPQEMAAAEPQTVPSVEPFVLAAVKEWAFIQNTGDFEAYKTFYTQDFTGVKRSGTYEYFYDREGWLEDRKCMFLDGFSVSVNNPVLEKMEYEWKVTFMQVWSSDSYKDRGRKKLLIRKEDGEFRIFREEMLNSVILTEM